jgi:hypothetical protein
VAFRGDGAAWVAGRDAPRQIESLAELRMIGRISAGEKTQ